MLESGEFLKVGSSTVQKTDVRIVAATNVDLLDAVKKGKFREDLYYRLSTISIEVPDLHDRGDDIYLLARKFASDFSRKYMTEPISFSPEAVHALSIYRWPGNVRQLKNIIEQLALFNAGQEISRAQFLESLPIDHSGLSTPATTQHPRDYEAERKMLWQLVLSLKADIEQLKMSMAGNKPDLNDNTGEYCEVPPVTSLIKYPDTDYLAPQGSLQQAEKNTILETLARNNGNKRKTAEDLNISVRTLYRKLQEYEI